MIFLIAVAVRLVVFSCVAVDESRMSGPDAEDYQLRAENLLRHGVFSGLDLSNGVHEPDGSVVDKYGRVIATAGPYLYDVHRTPGYPLFLVAIYKLCGERPMWVALVQCGLGALTCVVVFQLAQFLGDRQAAFWAGLWLALELMAVLLCNALLTETLFTLLLTTAVLALFHVHRAGNFGWAIVAGLCIGVAILCRPIGLYLIVIPTAWLAVSGSQVVRRRMLASLLFAGCSAVVLVPWMLRNNSHFGQWQITSIQGLNLFSFKAPYLDVGCLGRLHPDRFEAAQHAMTSEFTASLGDRRLNYLEMSREYQSAALRRIAARPVDYAIVHLSGTLSFFGLLSPHTVRSILGVSAPGLPRKASDGLPTRLIPRVLEYVSQLPAWFWGLYVAALLWSSAIILLAVWNVFATWHDRSLRPYVCLLVLCVAYFCLSAGPQGDARFRHPTMPLMSVLAGYGVERLRAKWQHRDLASQGLSGDSQALAINDALSVGDELHCPGMDVAR